MARELFCIEEGNGPQTIGDVYASRDAAELQERDPRESVVRYVPDDVEARAVLLSLHAGLSTFAEKLSLRRLPAELYFEFAKLVKAAEGGSK